MTSPGMMSSIERPSVAQDMWDVLLEFEHVLDDLKRLSSSSESVPSASNESTPAHTAKPPESTPAGQVTPTNHTQPIGRDREQRPCSMDMKGIISRFEEMPSSPIPLRNPSRQPQIASKHDTNAPTTPPIVIGRIMSPFLVRKEHDPTRADSHNTQDCRDGNGTMTPTSPVIGRIMSPFLVRKEHDPTRAASPEVGGVTAVPSDRRSSTPSQEQSGGVVIPVIRVNSAKSGVAKEVEGSDDHLTTVSGHTTKSQQRGTQLSISEHRVTPMDQANGEPRGSEGSASGPSGVVPPTGPEEGAHKLCEGWTPHSSGSQELSPPSPLSPWTSDVGVIPMTVPNLRNGEEDDDTILWMETPIDDHLVLMRPRVESEVLRRPAFQHDTVVSPSFQMHPLDSPPTRKRNIRASSLRKWSKRLPVEPLEMSSEFTQCLSASEVQNLNQERPPSPERARSKGSKLSFNWPKKSKAHSPVKESTSPTGKKTHFATPSPKPNKHRDHVDLRLSNGGMWEYGEEGLKVGSEGGVK